MNEWARNRNFDNKERNQKIEIQIMSEWATTTAKTKRVKKNTKYNHINNIKHGSQPAAAAAYDTEKWRCISVAKSPPRFH